MSVALYRKYRPKTFSEVTNQTHIKVTLQNEIMTARIGHAYLFCGPRGTGKTTMARLLAKAVNCLDIQPNAEPCNKCSSCQEITDNRAMDIIEIDAASHTGIDNVRENIIENVRFTPTKSKFKVFIIDEVHMLSTASFNALLKTLEEPPSYVIFILATTEIHKVPATIMSRCQRFDFKKIILNELVSRLRWMVKEEGVSVDEKVLSLIAKQAGGCVRDAESLLEQVLSLGEKNITLEQAELILPKANFDLLYNLFELIIKKQTGPAITLVNQLVADGIDIGQFTDNFIEFTRKILLYKITNNLEELAREIEESIVSKIVAMCASVSEQRVAEIIGKCLSDKELFRQNSIAQLPLEMAVWELTQEAGESIKYQVQSAKEVSNLKPQVQSEPKIAKPVANYQLPVTSPQLPVAKEEIKEPKIEIKTDEPVVAVEENEGSMDSASPFEAENTKSESRNPNNEENPNIEIEKREVAAAIAEDVVNEAKVESVSDSKLDFSGVMARWSALLNKVKESNHAMFLSLCMAKPLSCQNGRLTLGFLFDLQRKKIDDIKSKAILVQLMQEVFGHKLELATTVDSRLTLSDLPSSRGPQSYRPSQSDDAVNSLASEFGGEVMGEL